MIQHKIFYCPGEILSIKQEFIAFCKEHKINFDPFYTNGDCLIFVQESPHNPKLKMYGWFGNSDNPLLAYGEKLDFEEFKDKLIEIHCPCNAPFPHFFMISGKEKKKCIHCGLERANFPLNAPADNTENKV